MPRLPEAHYEAIAKLEICMADASKKVAEQMDEVLERLYRPDTTRPGDLAQVDRWWNCVGLEGPYSAKLLQERRKIGIKNMALLVKGFTERGVVFALERDRSRWVAALMYKDDRRVFETAGDPYTALDLADKRR